MSNPVSLISSAVITSDELAAFLPTVGARATPAAAFLGQLSEGNRHVWISIDNTPLEDFDQQELDVLTRLLGDIPRTLIGLEISRASGSQQLAVRFALATAERWPCVVDDTYGKIYTPQQLEEMRRTGATFW